MAVATRRTLDQHPVQGDYASMSYSPPPPDPTRLLVVVDGPNLVNRCGTHLKSVAKSAAPRELQARYFQEWFDIDRVVRATLAGTRLDPWRDLGTVVFHSHNGLGREPYRFSMTGKADDVVTFWGRQGNNPNTSTMVVQIPGGPSARWNNAEPFDEDEGPAEKGVDMSMAVYLYDTLDAWDTAVLFTNDTDFVPAVWSLRRRGKRVHCAAIAGKKLSPLAAACQHFIPLSLSFLEADRALFEMLQPEGALGSFLAEAGTVGAYRCAIGGRRCPQQRVVCSRSG